VYNLGLASLHLGEPERSLAALAEAEHLASPRQLGFRADIRNHVGLAYAHQGELARAKQCFQESLAIMGRRLGRHTLEAERELARLDLSEGDFESAERRVVRVMLAAETLRNPRDVALATVVYGETLLHLERHRPAHFHLTTARRQLERLGMKQSAQAATGLINQCFQRRRWFTSDTLLVSSSPPQHGPRRL